MGVTDIATVRFSLPSQLLEPIPNLGAYLAVQEPDTLPFPNAAGKNRAC